jgi:hypothetical protein
LRKHIYGQSLFIQLHIIFSSTKRIALPRKKKTQHHLSAFTMATEAEKNVAGSSIQKDEFAFTSFLLFTFSLSLSFFPSCLLRRFLFFYSFITGSGKNAHLFRC